MGSVRDLRTYVATLRDKTTLPGEFLIMAVKKQAERFERFYGIRVETKSDISPRLSGAVGGRGLPDNF